jgi:putative methionine-R-sulfoxide reductase with GAF domain
MNLKPPRPTVAIHTRCLLLGLFEGMCVCVYVCVGMCVCGYFLLMEMIGVRSDERAQSLVGLFV